MNLLFVYGTLLPEFQLPISDFLTSESEVVGRGFVFGKLYDLGEYPGLVPDDSRLNRVFGNLYRLRNSESVFHILDEYEGIHQSGQEENEYIRTLIEVHFGEKQIVSYVYLYVGEVAHQTWIPSGDYLSYQEKK
jgi:gamma-glutamylcyclotransferase (GGCT)/AIG2-like uncharacterized protein YtfP